MSDPLTKNEKLTLVVAGVTAIIALVAVGISLWANSISGDAYELASKSYFDERRIFLRTISFDEGGLEKGLIFEPLDELQQVSNMTIFFPSKLEIPPITLTPPTLKLYQSTIEYQIKKYLKKKIPAEEGRFKYTEHYPIQVFIGVQGYTKGVSITTAGVYNLIFSHSQIESSEPTTELKSAVLNNYTLSVEGGPQKYIDEVFSQFEAYSPNN